LKYFGNSIFALRRLFCNFSDWSLEYRTGIYLGLACLKFGKILFGYFMILASYVLPGNPGLASRPNFRYDSRAAILPFYHYSNVLGKSERSFCSCGPCTGVEIYRAVYRNVKSFCSVVLRIRIPFPVDPGHEFPWERKTASVRISICLLMRASFVPWSGSVSRKFPAALLVSSSFVDPKLFIMGPDPTFQWVPDPYSDPDPTFKNLVSDMTFFLTKYGLKGPKIAF
jgi:hypothetical protein